MVWNWNESQKGQVKTHIKHSYSPNDVEEIELVSSTSNYKNALCLYIQISVGQGVYVLIDRVELAYEYKC